MLLVASGQIAYAEEWQTIEQYQVKDGLVKDTKTGLMWMRCSLGQEWDGSTCKGEGTENKWDEAMKQANSSHEGFNDWRVPTHEELRSLVYCSSGLPSTWNQPLNKEIKGQKYSDGCKGEYAHPTIFNSVFLNTPPSWFWSSSPVADDNSSYARIVGFGNGGDNAYPKNYYGYFVRLVRSGQ